MLPWILLALVALGAFLLLWVPRYRLNKAVEAPFPEPWVALLEQNIQVYQQLPMPLRLQLRKLIKQFLHQKHFSGAGGLEMTDEIRVTIAAEACMLILNRSSRVYPGLKYIIVYPTTFVADHGHADEAGIAGHGPRTLLGESWQAGKVILAWDSVQHGARNFLDGQNVVLHEFAHQLDSETGSANGAPLLGGAKSYSIWAKVLSSEFEKLQAASRKGRRSLMDHYGATNPAEFFAVATETFFEKPRRMARDHGELFSTLKAYYR
ncbi:MAG: zinc-dependent peptidase, partial [Gammaproteobacteria bacterium]|nr:zinc-dependent peptidase [Gammaproteobacteria bacterium]